MVSHEEAGAEHMKVITQLHPRKTQHHVHNCLNLSNCCGSKCCRVLTLLLSTITYEMFFKESNISCTIKRFLPRFLWIPLKRWTPLAKPFPLFIAGPVLDNDGLQPPLGKHSQRGDIGGQQILCYQWSPQTLRCIPLIFHHSCRKHFSSLQLCLQTWFPWTQHLANLCF